MNVISTHQQLKCSKHPNNQIIFIQVNQPDEDKHIFYCEQCMIQDKTLQMSNCVQIKQIIEYSNNSQIINWPPVDDLTLKDQIYNIYTQVKNQDQLERQIVQYFDSLKAEIFSKLESHKKQMISKAQIFSEYEDQILKKIQESQKADLFKSILLNDNAEINTKEKQCKDFINQVKKEKQNYTLQLKQIFDKLNQNQQYIDYETPQLMKKSILQLIENINFFDDKNNFNKQANIIQKNKQNNQKEQNIDKLIDLISVKSNFLTDQFIDSIKKILYQISPLIDQIPFDQQYQNNNQQIDFSKLCDKQMKKIRDLAEYYGQYSANKNLINQIKQQNQFKQISLILNNKSNYLQEKFIEEFEKYIIETYPLLNSINFKNAFKDCSQIETFINIEDENLFYICELTKKKKELEQNNLLKNSQSFKINQQIQSYLKQFKKKDLDNLLKKYPIYDLLTPLKNNRDLLRRLQIFKSNYQQQNSINIQMKKLENNSFQIISPSIGNNGNYYSNMIIDRNQKYVFRFQFNRSKKQGEEFSIGLVRDETKDIVSIFKDNLYCSFYYSSNNNGMYSKSGIGKILKGDLSDTKEINCVELRVCIKDNLLEILDYPNYNHQYGLSDQYKNNLQTYQNLRLGIHLQNEIELILISAKICEQFQN